MTVKLSPLFNDAQLDSNGNPYSGAKLFTYLAGSSTKATTFQDSGALASHTNPLVLNSRGEPPAPIWLTTGVIYKFVFTAPTDSDPPVSPIRTIDNVSAVNDVAAATADEWLTSGAAPTFVSATSFTLAGDQRTEFHIGRRLKSTNSGGTIYSTISNSVFGALTTVTVVNDSGVLDSGLSAVAYGIVRATNPSIARLNGALTLTGALAVNGNTTLGDAAGDTTTITGNSFIGDTSNAKATLGLTINQGAVADEILSFKGSDIAHGVTSIAETDTFGKVGKWNGSAGGIGITGFAAAGASIAMGLYAIAAAGTTTKSTSAVGNFYMIAEKANGTTTSSLGANENIVAFSMGSATRFILDADGDSHQDVGTAWTNFDTFDDIALLDALSVAVSSPDDPIKENFRDFLKYNRPVLEAAKLVTFNEDGHHFVNMSKLTMALTGAVRQVGHRLAAMEERMLALEAK